MVLELKGYDVNFDNKVYTSQDSIPAQVMDREEEFKKVLIFSRFLEPSEDEVIQYLQEKAGGLIPEKDKMMQTNHFDRGEYLPLEQLMLQLPYSTLQDLSDMNKPDYEQKLREKNNAPRLEPGETPNEFFKIKFGFLPDRLIEDCKSEGNITNPSWYFMMFNFPENKSMIPGRYHNMKNMGQNFEMYMILEDGKLIPKSDMEVLVRQGVDSSDHFFVNVKPFPRTYGEPLLKAIYDAMPNLVVPFPTEENTFQAARERFALQSISGFIGYMSTQRVGGKRHTTLNRTTDGQSGIITL